jgi:glycine/D-amino acid oxidase-like deaminating enzyme
VLEAGDEGSGASTRNGGMVIPELKHGPDALARRHGDTGRAMLRETLAAYAFVRDLVANEAIACDWRVRRAPLAIITPECRRCGRRRAVGAAGQPVRLLAAADLGRGSARTPSPPGC